MTHTNYSTDRCEMESDRPDGDRIKSISNQEAAVKEAGRCLANNACTSCDLCRYFCPDLCISRNRETGKIEIDYDFCKGCGICAFICPKGAIAMVDEK